MVEPKDIRKQLGLVHIYTGHGKGKTTAALGLGLRASGRGLRVLVVQFLKSETTGELRSVEMLGGNFQIYRADEILPFTWTMTPDERVSAMGIQRKLLERARLEVEGSQWDLLILDEVLGALGTGLLELSAVVDLVKNRPGSVEVVLTGRDPPEELVELADYVSEIRPVKHPMTRGIHGRIGIEN